MAYKLSNDIIKKSKNFSLIIFPILIWSLVTSSIEVKTILVIIISIIYMKYDFDLSNFKFKSFKLPFSILFIVIIITQNQFSFHVLCVF